MQAQSFFVNPMSAACPSESYMESSSLKKSSKFQNQDSYCDTAGQAASDIQAHIREIGIKPCLWSSFLLMHKPGSSRWWEIWTEFLWLGFGLFHHSLENELAEKKISSSVSISILVCHSTFQTNFKTLK